MCLHAESGPASRPGLARLGAQTAAENPGEDVPIELLVEGDFELVRNCEHPDCILWFYDRTRSHKRRWCSMATCGNRYKAARFRERRGGSGA